MATAARSTWECGGIPHFLLNLERGGVALVFLLLIDIILVMCSFSSYFYFLLANTAFHGSLQPFFLVNMAFLGVMLAFFNFGFFWVNIAFCFSSSSFFFCCC